MKTLLLTGVLAAMALAVTAAANAKRLTLEEHLSKWQKTGTTERCLRLADISLTDVWDDRHILFKMKGKKAYLNTLPNACPRLGSERRFMHEVWMNEVCDVDMITVLESPGHNRGASCRLGKFEEVTPVKPAKSAN